MPAPSTIELTTQEAELLLGCLSFTDGEGMIESLDADALNSVREKLEDLCQH